MKPYPYPETIADAALRPPCGIDDRRFCFEVRDRARRALSRRALQPFARAPQWRAFLAGKYQPRHARVLWHHGKRLGYFQIYFLRRGEVYIDMLYLAPAARGQGLASRMIAHVRDVARAAGAIASISAITWNPAYDLYRRMGFAVANDAAHGHDRISRWMRLRPYYAVIARGPSHLRAAARLKA